MRLRFEASMVFVKGVLSSPDRIAAVVASSPRRGRRCRARVVVAVCLGRTGQCRTTPLALAENFTPFEFAVSGGREGEWW